MTSLLAFGIVISFILFFPVDSSLKITVNTSQELENHLCNQSLSIPDVIFELDTPNYNISNGNFCIVSKFTNVTLQTNNPKTATITCFQEDYPYPTTGLAFINCTVTFRRVTFINCGTYLPDNFTGFLNSPSLYYTPTHAAALLFIQCEVHMREVALNSSYGFAVIGINLIDSVLCKVNVSSSLSSEVYENDNKTIGSGVLLHFLDIPYSLNKSIAIEDSKFLYNIDLFNGSCITDVYYSSKQSKKPFHKVHAAGLTILYTQQHFKANVSIERTNFSHNIGSSSGALLILHYNTTLDSSTVINNSQFKRNANWLYCHGAALQFYWFARDTFDHVNQYHHPLVVTNTQFTEHVGIVEDKYSDNQSTGAVYIGIVNPTNISLNIMFKNSTFQNNKVAYAGACVFASVYENVGSVGDVSITLENITADQNSQDILHPIASNAGMFSFYEISEVIIKGNSVFTRNYGSVIYAVVSNVYLHDKIEFKENQGRKGAAIRLEGYSYLYLKKGFNATFISNKVQLSGGAIYANSGFHTPKGRCTIQIETGNGTKLTFVNNEAKISGNSIFVTSMFYCYIDERFYASPKHALTIYTNYFTFHHSHHNNTLLNISTDPVHLKLYYDNGTQIPKGVFLNKYPGETFTIRLAAVDAAERYVYSTIEVAVACEQGSKNCSNQFWLPKEQYETELLESSNKTTTPINITIHTKSKNTNDGMLIFSLPLYPATRTLQFQLLPCPLGFSYNKKSGNCECSKAFSQLKKFHHHSQIDIQCYITNQTITRPRFITYSWMGQMKINENSEFGISPTCPLGYCITDPPYHWIRIVKNDVNVNTSFLTDGSMSNHEPLCLYNREGALCGKCKEVNGHQYGTVFGSPECKECSNLWLLTILLYVFLGLLFVYLLYALRLTLTTGTLNGIIFFAQAANGGLIDFLNSLKYDNNQTLKYVSKFCVGFLSIINLNGTFSICFFKGMTQLYKTGLMLVPTFFLLTVVVIVIFLSRKSLKFSNRISHSSVQILVTIIHLSFSNLLLIVIDVFTYATIYTAHRPYKVWYWDGTVEYMGHPHLILVIVSLIAIIPLLIPYITLLLFGKPLIRHFALVNKYMRPLYESIHAPYKENKQYWFVLRLLLLIIMYIMNILYITHNPMLIFVFTAPILVTFLVIQAFMNPFKNKLITYLDSWIMLILTFTYMTTWYYLQPGKYEPHNSAIICVVAVLMVFLTAVIIFIGHILWVTGHLHKMEFRFHNLKHRINERISTIRHQNATKIVSLKDTSDSYYGSCSQYREPILSPSS